MRDRIRYYVVKNGNAFWAPGAQALALSLPASQPLGPDNEDAKKLALDWNARLDKARKPDKRTPAYPPGTLGFFYLDYFKRKAAWAIMEPRTREDYERAWTIIGPRFAAKHVTKITADDSERLHVALHPAHNPKSTLSANEAHRTLKVWRALLNALRDYEFRTLAPIGRVSNPAPKGREGVWLHEEVLQLSFAACLLGMTGMAAAIRLGWAGMLSPVDVWTLPVGAWKDGLIHHERQKTGTRILVRVDGQTRDVVSAYLESCPSALPKAPLIRRANGKGYISKDTFGDDFRAVRSLAFPGDGRQFLDLRRSAATEARRGGATRDDLGKAMANRIDASDALAATYLLDASDRVLDARETGRRKLAGG